MPYKFVIVRNSSTKTNQPKAKPINLAN